MKKFLWISFLLGLIFLWGCATTNKLSTSELFEKKQECLSYKETIVQKIQDYDDQIRDIEKSQWYYMEHKRTLSELFYSPVRNSCLYSIHLVEETSKGDMIDWYQIKDFFDEDYSGETIISDDNYNLDQDASYLEYKKTIKKLKWE